MQIKVNLKSPNDTYTGSVAIGDGEQINFTTGEAYFESEDKKAMFPPAGRLRRVNAGITRQFGANAHLIEDREPTDFVGIPYLRS